MGRFYETAKPTFVDDVIYQAPYEMMMNALQTQDAEFKSNQDKADSFSTMGDLLQHTDKDSDAKNEALNKYRGEAERIAELMNENPALYEAHIGELNRAKKAFEQDIKSGSLFEMDKTAKRRDKVRADLKERFDKNIISSDSYNASLKKLDNDYQGHGVNEYAEDIHTYEQIDEAAFQKDLKASINIDSAATTTTKPQGNGYMIQRGESVSYLTKERLESIIDSDPTMDKWKREQMQTLERQFENGDFETQEEVDDEYRSRLQKFKENTIEKLNFQKIETSDNTSTDSAYFQRQSHALAMAKFAEEKKKAEREGISYQVELSGNYRELPDSTVDNLYGSAKVQGVGPGKDGKPVTEEMSTKEKRARLDIEKNKLQADLEKSGKTMGYFRDKMKTFEGRNEMMKLTGLSLDQVVRQAKYDKSYTLKPVLSPIDDGADPKENKKFLNVVENTFNNLGIEDVVNYKLIRANGEVVEAKEGVTLGSLQEDNRKLVSGQAAATEVKDLAPMVDDIYGAGFMGVDNEFITMPDPSGKEKNGVPLQVAATKDYVLRHGIGKNITTKQNVFDATKPLLNIGGDAISQSTEVDYGDGNTEVKEKNVYNVRMSKMIDGELMTVLINKELDIKPVKN